MRLGRKPKPSIDLDLPSFSDLAFLLIIFFVLTTTFVNRLGTEITIPSSTSDPAKKSEKKYPTINLAADRLLLDTQEMTIDGLRQRLASLKLAEKADEDRVIVLDSSADVPFDRYFKVVVAISQAKGVLAILEPEEKEQKP